MANSKLPKAPVLARNNHPLDDKIKEFFDASPTIKTVYSTASGNLYTGYGDAVNEVLEEENHEKSIKTWFRW